MATPGYDPHLALWLIFHGDDVPETTTGRKLSANQRRDISNIVDLITYGDNSDDKDHVFLFRFKHMRKENIGTSRLKKSESFLVQGLIECLNDYQGYDAWTNPDNIRLGVYDHFKGGVYKIRGFSSWASGEGEKVVEYDSLIYGTPHTRLASQWCEVTLWPDGKYRSRFVYRGPDLHTPKPSFKVPSPK